MNSVPWVMAPTVHRMGDGQSTMAWAATCTLWRKESLQTDGHREESGSLERRNHTRLLCTWPHDGHNLIFLSLVSDCLFDACGTVSALSAVKIWTRYEPSLRAHCWMWLSTHIPYIPWELDEGGSGMPTGPPGHAKRGKTVATTSIINFSNQEQCITWSGNGNVLVMAVVSLIWLLWETFF